MKRTHEDVEVVEEQKTFSPFQIVHVKDDGTDILMAVSRLGECWAMAWMNRDDTCHGPIYLFPIHPHYSDFEQFFGSIEYDFKKMNKLKKGFAKLESGSTWAAICGYFATVHPKDDPLLPLEFNVKENREKAYKKLFPNKE